MFAGLLSVVERAAAPAWGIQAAILSSLTVLAVQGFVAPERFSQGRDPGAWNDVHAVVRALARMRKAVNTKWYARPSANLVLTFYTGLPIQSIAPVRREFLDSFPGTVVFITGARTELVTRTPDSSLSDEDKDIPMLRGMTVGNWDDWWQAFFYRYSGYEQRRGERANYVSRLQGAKAIKIEGGRTVF